METQGCPICDQTMSRVVEDGLYTDTCPEGHFKHCHGREEYWVICGKERKLQDAKPGLFPVSENQPVTRQKIEDECAWLRRYYGWPERIAMRHREEQGLVLDMAAYFSGREVWCKPEECTGKVAYAPWYGHFKIDRPKPPKKPGGWKRWLPFNL